MNYSMNEIKQLNPHDILPQKKNVLRYQGIPKRAIVPERILMLFSEAVEIFLESARPEMMISELSIEEFEEIFKGEGSNAHDVLLQNIFPHADFLALFALTMGKKISAKIEELFQKHDYAIGSMLDSAASTATEEAIKMCESLFFDDISNRGKSYDDLCVLNYSPGYCGWDIDGQNTIFQYLQPERIGISLSKSSLMTPIKSATGLLVAGRKEIHLFKECQYSYCADCTDHSCVARMKSVKRIGRLSRKSE